MKKLLFGLALAAVVVLANATIYLPFTATPATPQLTVSLVGTGAGTITSSPAGINCPSTCSATFSNGTAVTLTATPVASNASSTVHGTGTELFAWGGTACTGQSSSGSCALTFNGTTTASAKFTPKDSDIWWIDTAGSDTNNCKSLKTPCATIHKVNLLMTADSTNGPGGTLYFNDGTYNDSLGGNGGSFTKDVVDGTASKSTRFLAYNANAATVSGQYTRMPLYLWHNNYVEVGYMRFMYSSGGPCAVDGSSGLNANFNATYVYIHDSACAYTKPGGAGANVLALSANHCSNCTFERNWVWGFGTRYGVALYGGINNVIRQNVVRYDGAPDGQPKAGITLYDEDNSIAENNISLDFDKGTDSGSDVHASMFTTSSVTTANYPYGLGTVAWYGNIAINTGVASAGIYIDSHASIGSGASGLTQATITVKDNIVAGMTNASVGVAGLWLSADDSASTNPGHHAITFNHNTVYGAQAGAQMRVDNYSYTSVALNNNILHGGPYSSSGCYNQQWVGTATATNNLWYSCNNALYTAFPSSTTSNPAFSWLENVTSGPAFGAASDSGNIGASVVYKYNNGTLTGNALWPFPNESQILADLCAGPDTSTAVTCEATNATSCTIYTRTHNTSGFCASGKSLTKYIWEQLGNTSPY